MYVRQTTPEENRRITELFGIAFEFPVPSRESAPPQAPESSRFRHWAAYDEETGGMMSTLLVREFDYHFDGRPCKMGGIGGVSTLPQYRRQGGIRGCFSKALPAMYESGFSFSYLYPFSTCYYRQFGYECSVQKYELTVHLGLLNPAPVGGTLRLAERQNPMTGAFMQLDQVWERRYSLMVTHSEADYEWTKTFDPAVSQSFSYVYFAPDGTPKAYTTFRKENQPDGRNLVADRFCFADREGFLGLMKLFKLLSADHAYAKFCVPADTALQYLMPEWSLGAAQWKVVPAGMIRVINARKVLEDAAYLGSGQAVLQILDPQIPENNHCFALEFENGKARSVTVCDGAEPDAILKISAFSAMISGAAEFAGERQWMGGLEICRENPCFAQIFYKKPAFIQDYF